MTLILSKRFRKFCKTKSDKANTQQMINAKISSKAKAFLRSKASRIVALTLAKQEDTFNKITLVDNPKQEKKSFDNHLKIFFAKFQFNILKTKQR